MPATNNFNTPRPEGQPQNQEPIEESQAVGRAHLLMDEMEPGTLPLWLLTDEMLCNNFTRLHCTGHDDLAAPYLAELEERHAE